MKVRKIKTIKNYKSFLDFSWHNFFNNENFCDEVNLLFGENGSGKSSICNILKSVSQNKDFYKYAPDEACLKIDNIEYKYLKSVGWNQKLKQGSILFFDKEFVDKNVHLGHDRGTLQGEQEQESGKMIIQFDGDAINLRSVRDKLKKAKDDEEERIKQFISNNKNYLDFPLDDNDLKLFEKLKGKTGEELKKIKKELKDQKKEIEKKLEIDRERHSKVEKIQNDIAEIKKESFDFLFSDYATYQNLFNFDLKEQVRIEAEQELVDKIKAHKDFFEYGFKIRKTHPNKCPFCQTENEEEKINEIIKLYNQIYDDTYKEQKRQFLNKKEALIEELKIIRKTINDFDLGNIFLELKRLDQNYKIKNIYSVEEEKQHQKPLIKKIKDLENKISALKVPSKENIRKLYDEAETELKSIKIFFENLNKFIEEKNKIITKFRLDNTDEKIQVRITENKEKLDKIEKELDFIKNNKIEKAKKKIEKEKELKKLKDKLEEVKVKYKEARQEYEDYCSKKAFAKLLNKIESYFKKFNFSFTLKLDTERRTTGITKEFPFAFKVLDSEGNERNFKEGLSEGEWQVLSLCFFFAFLEIQKDKDKKILVFDDPITSLDNSNLSCLVDLIAEEQSKFSQTFIFTHHRTFFKFLRKKFNEKCKEYNILRNKKELGGSFICKSKPKKFIDKLKNFENHLQNIPPESIDIELKIVEYGQYLRYEVERFIKNELLHWDKAHDFTKAIEGVKLNQKINPSDLDKIRKIYAFCNWTTSHVDVGDDHGLSQLKDKIKDFVSIVKS